MLTLVSAASGPTPRTVCDPWSRLGTGTVNIRLCITPTHAQPCRNRWATNGRAATRNNFSPAPQWQEGRLWP